MEVGMWEVTPTIMIRFKSDNRVKKLSKLVVNPLPCPLHSTEAFINLYFKQLLCFLL